MPIERRRRKKSSESEQEPSGQSDPNKVDREALLAALSRLKPAIRSGDSIPALTHIWFSGQHVFAYDGGLGVRVVLDTNLECGLPGQPLLRVLGTSSLKNVSLEPDESLVLVRLGSSRLKLKSMDLEPDLWPFPLKTESSASKANLDEVFVEALRNALMVKVSKPTRTEHHGLMMYYDKKEGMSDIYATDSYTIARASLAVDHEMPELLVLPRALAEQVVAQCPGGAELSWEDNYLLAQSDEATIGANALDPEGIDDLRRVIDKNLKDHPDEVPLPAGLEAALDRAQALSSGPDDPLVDIRVDGKDFRVSGKYTYGDLQEDLQLEESHPDTDIRMSAGLIRRGLLRTTSFSADDRCMTFYRGDDFLYMVAAAS